MHLIFFDIPWHQVALTNKNNMNKESLEKARMLSQQMDDVCRQILEKPQSDKLKQQYRELKEELSRLLLQKTSEKDHS